MVLLSPFRVALLVLPFSVLMGIPFFIRNRRRPSPLLKSATVLCLVAGLTSFAFVGFRAARAYHRGLLGRTTEQPAPDIAMATSDGRQIRLTDLRGKIVLVDFWATWCPSCTNSRTMLVRLHERYAGQGVAVVGISADEDEMAWRNFLAKNGQRWTECLDRDKQAQDAFSVHSYPSYVLIDRQGTQRFRLKGHMSTTEAQLSLELEKLLRK